jgi:hypothetical protein
MSEWRRAVSRGRRDDAEPSVVEVFEAGGATVWKIAGKDIPDLLVGYLGVNHAVEVKTSNAKLRPGQSKCHGAWTGEPPVVARTPAQARKWLRIWAERRTTLNDVLRAEHAACPDVSCDAHPVNRAEGA